MDAPARFGKYTVLERISVGGMAEVFRAKAADGKLVAIKRILPHVAEDPTFIKMFIEEARITSQLVHPNICRIYELGRIDGSHFIAMEYIRGKDLIQVRNRLRERTEPMPLGIVAGIIGKALDGLDYAHRKRDAFGRALELVHRDCSPHNLLLSEDGEVKVIDFGIAKAKSSVMKSQAGVLKGKFGYMAPEQVMGKPIDHRIDLFACGVIMYELVTGEPLFTGDSDFAILDKVRRVEMRPPREVCPEIPPILESVILKALAVDPDKRYPWCSDMKADLDRYGGATSAELSAWLRDLFATSTGPATPVIYAGPEDATQDGPPPFDLPPPAGEFDDDLPTDVRGEELPSKPPPPRRR
jgi:serine/threonine protein kinase